MQSWREVSLQWFMVAAFAVLFYYIYLAGTKSSLIKPLF